jgi:hypothetical protein
VFDTAPSNYSTEWWFLKLWLAKKWQGLESHLGSPLTTTHPSGTPSALGFGAWFLLTMVILMFVWGFLSETKTMNLKKAFSAITEKSQSASELLEHRGITGSRFLVLVGFVALLFVAVRMALNPLTLYLAGLGVGLYMITNTWSRVVTTKCNRDIRIKMMELLGKDGKLDKGDQKAIHVP